MPRLVALAAEPGERFVAALSAAWDAGDVVLPVDSRLPVPPSFEPPLEDGDALVVATSGTTGEPKGAVLTHDAVRAAAEATSGRLAVDPAVDTWLSCLPLAHVGGLGVVTRALLTGTPLVFEGPATLTALVRTQLRRTDVSGFRAVLLGGGPPPPDVPPNVVVTYGMTETGGGVVYDGVPLDGVAVRADEDGQLWVRGPMLLRCYDDGTDPKVDGWFPTGDLGAVDDDGRVVVHGRAAEVIVTGGEKVWPSVVEDVLRTHPSVADVVVAGRSDDEWGERVVAYVVPAGEPPSLDELRGHVKERLPAWCAPRDLVLVDSIPRTALGKVRRL
ncbi:MAG TPA: AMP-binding protein [Acidimicrobiales bacterium]|nr:AMP-binding protein [Acidimicrobiales bacterium]